MKRILGLLFLSSSAFIVAPVVAQEGSGGEPSADASVPDPTDAAPGGGSNSGSGGSSNGGKGGGGKGGAPPRLEPIGAEPREYDLLENEGKACSVSSLSARPGSGAALFLAGAAAAVSVRRRRARRT